MSTYLVAWTGGYEEPGYFATPDSTEAANKFTEWAKDCTESGESVQLLLIGDDQRTVTIMVDTSPDDDEEEVAEQLAEAIQKTPPAPDEVDEAMRSAAAAFSPGGAP